MRNVILDKIADKGFQRLGYEKAEDDECLVSYEIYDIKYHFTKCIRCLLQIKWQTSDTIISETYKFRWIQQNGWYDWY